MEGQKVRRPVFKFLDRYFARIVAGAGFVLGLAEGVTGQFTGVTRGRMRRAGILCLQRGAVCLHAAPGAGETPLILPNPDISPYVVRFDDEGIIRNVQEQAGMRRCPWADLVMVAITIRKTAFCLCPFFMLDAEAAAKAAYFPVEAVARSRNAARTGKYACQTLIIAL